MYQQEPAIICKNGNAVVAYILAMKEDSEQELPILKSIFQKFKEVCYEEKTISTYNFIVIGQVCAAIEGEIWSMVLLQW